MCKKAIIYGYSAVGEAAYQECMKRGIEIVCYCEDSKIRRNGISANRIPIMPLNEIAEKKIEGDFIICIPDAEPVIAKLEYFGYKNWYLADDFFAESHYRDYRYTRKSHAESVKEIESCVLSHKYLLQNEKIFMRNIDLEITEKCSMRCRDCSNLMAYYKSPKDYSVEEITEWVRDLLEYVDEIYEIRLLGGEPFMHKGIHKIIKNLLQFHSIHRILIYSNATIFPTEEMWEIMENERVGFSITDYGSLSRNITRIKEELDRRSISYDVHYVGGWTQCSTIYKHERAVGELEYIYRECCAKNLITLLNGIIYKCPFMANATNLEAIPDVKEDAIRLKELALLDKKKAKTKLRYFLKEKSLFAGCDYCEGRLFGAEKIEPAIQIESPRLINERW